MSTDYFLESTDLPMAAHAEKTLLGAILLNSSRILEIAGVLHEGDFCLDSHNRIFRAMASLAEKDSAIDFVTLTQALIDSRELGVVGGASYVASLTEGLPMHPEVEDYTRLVKDKAICRALLGFTEALRGRAYSSDQPGLEIASWGISELSRISESHRLKTEVFASAEMAEESEFRLLDNPSESSALPTGVSRLDEMTSGGIRLGELWVIGASPSRGKTTLARQIVKSAISRDVPCYVHSGEMTKESWLDVTACMISDVPAWKTRDPRLFTFVEKENLRAGLRRVSKMPLYISDAGGIQLDRLIWLASREIRSHQIRLFAIDYAQIISAPGRDERQKVSNVASKLRLFAKEENVAVVLLSQSPRPEGRSINARPTMFSLKESGALEEAAHAVILPYRPVDESGSFTGEDELIIGKQRWGPIGSVPVTLNGKYLRFEPR